MLRAGKSRIRNQTPRYVLRSPEKLERPWSNTIPPHGQNANVEVSTCFGSLNIVEVVTQFAGNCALRLETGARVGELHGRIEKLSGMLFDILGNLSESEYQKWCDLVEFLNLKVSSQKALWSFSLTPEQYEPDEMHLHEHRVQLEERSHEGECFSRKDQSSILEFSWDYKILGRNRVEKATEIFHESNAPLELPAISRDDRITFEEFVSSVLDVEGQMEFMTRRFYGGPQVDTKYLFRKYSEELRTGPQDRRITNATGT